LRCLAVALALTLTLFAASTTADHGTCGHQCVQDSDCDSGCGSASKCICPDTKYPAISCTCVAKPDNAPESPAVDVEDSLWPSQWSANVSAFVYGDFSNKSNFASGLFKYDGKGGHSRADWTPYTNQKDATQVWIGGTGSDSSRYYVKTGPICISFPITDPGSVGGSVSVERADWMRNCNASNMAQYMGREQVGVNGEDVWVDHFSCRVEYTEVNQSITFQNWHSLGLGSVPKGLPLRVTGGNSAPNPTQGSPRLSTVWYSNFAVGNSSVSPSDFEKPSWLCIPVVADAAEAYFGHKVTQSHVFDPAFHARAHGLPAHITRTRELSAPTSSDLSRAAQKVPGSAFSGNDFPAAMTTLNAHLQAEPGLETKPCSEFSLEELHSVQRILFEARSPQLQEVYMKNSDTRNLKHNSTADLEMEQTEVEAMAQSNPELGAMLHDGLCHETVMWFVHHLAEATQEEVKELLVLPLLPVVHHAKPLDGAATSAFGHQHYTDQVSCAICHVQ